MAKYRYRTLSIQWFLSVDDVGAVVGVHGVGPQFLSKICGVNCDLLLGPAQLRGHEADGALRVIFKSCTGDESDLLVLGVLGPFRGWDLE